MPEAYVQVGHLFRLASYAQLFTVLIGVMYSMFGETTQSRLAR